MHCFFPTDGIPTHIVGYPRDMNLDGTVVAITGASAGVGRAAARAFAEAGADVALVARGGDGLEAVSKEIEAAGGRSLILPVDVADPAAVEEGVARIEGELGPIGVWVNNAMTTIFAPFDEIAPDEFRRATEVTYLGSVWGTKAVLARMRRRDSGTIVQVGSALAYRGIPLQTAYCGSKHALQGFMESLRCELMHEKSNVRITTVHLPGLNTPQFEWCETRLPKKPKPVPPIFQPEVAARAIVWAACHPRRREYWVGGSTVATILGNYLSPGLLDRYLAKTNVDAQQREEAVEQDRPSNLWDPVEGDHGAHGDFDAKARSRSYQWMANERKATLTAVILGAVGAAASILRRRSLT